MLMMSGVVVLAERDEVLELDLAHVQHGDLLGELLPDAAWELVGVRRVERFRRHEVDRVVEGIARLRSAQVHRDNALVNAVERER